MVKNSAFTLIELIFAIIVISITVIALPMMNQVLNTGIEKNIGQEAIFAAATVLQETTTAHWDENSLESGQIYDLAKVIDTTGACENDSSLFTYRLMAGHIVQPLHRKCLDVVSTPSDSNTTSVNALEDAKRTNVPIFINTTNTKDTGYKTDYTATLSVTRPALFHGTSNPDIKKITIDIKNGASTITSLSTYSANIGEIDYYKKGY